MQRVAFTMKLKPGNAAEYERRHNPIWQELETKLKAAGISDYSIFLDEETWTLFAVQKVAETNTADQLSSDDTVRKWWEYMAPLMEVHPDHAPVSKPLREVFHLD